MNSTDPRRKRQILLFLSAILIPTVVLITLATRLARQDAELAEKRMVDERLHTLEQLRRELTARLDTIKLQELNRISNEPGSIEPAPADFPVVFVAPLVQNHLMLPWKRPARPVRSSPEFAQYQKEF